MTKIAEALILNLMPALFIGHGSPMNAIQQNSFTNVWKKLGDILPTPKAILSISAHWQTNGIYITGMDKPPTIHDFGGFPKQLFNVQYSAPGNSTLALNIVKRLERYNVKLDKVKWGLDHGTWSILVHMYPNANIPVIQLSLNKYFSLQEHYNFAKNLQQLRQQGVLIIGSGNIIHNLQQLNWGSFSSAHFWATKVKNQVNQFIINKKHDKLINYKLNGLEFIKAVNSEEHYIPLLYILALQKQDEKISFFNNQIIMGQLSMTSLIISSADQIHQNFYYKNQENQL